MDSNGLLSTVVDIFTKASDSAATGIASGAATLVIDLVRRRLVGSQEGRSVLAQVEENPSEVAAANALRAVLEREIAADSTFRAQLAAAVAGPPPVHQPSTIAHSVVLGSGNRLGKSQISLGPLTINNTRTARISLLAIAAAVAALLSLCGYLLADSFSSDSAGSVSNREVCEQALPLRTQVADMGDAAYAANVDKWRSVIDLASHASDARLAAYGKFAEQHYRNLPNYYSPLTDIIDYSCNGDASGLTDTPAP
ncbi:hypothetical protein ACIHEJ_16665 [Streptomyces sp. NPDC052301]|uniref:hypothetical protein n=1 Tax=Streptomyces sp. NPDC052301 TaxID=3365687 RepID=UPI0037D6B699